MELRPIAVDGVLMHDKKQLIDTWAMKPNFALKAHPRGQPFVVIEGMGGSLPVLGGGFLGFELFEGTTPTHAKEIIDFL